MKFESSTAVMFGSNLIFKGIECEKRRKGEL